MLIENDKNNVINIVSVFMVKKSIKVDVGLLIVMWLTREKESFKIFAYNTVNQEIIPCKAIDDNIKPS